MRYLLVVMTHGPRSATLERCLDSFVRHVTPAPALGYLNVDSDRWDHMQLAGAPARAVRTSWWVSLSPSGRQEGFCAATRRAWAYAAAQSLRWVFWLEHDFVFTRNVDLAQLADVLDDDHDLVQMSLMRNACNLDEAAAGGLYELHRDKFDRHRLIAPDEYEWLTHELYLTTTPSLLRTAFMREHPWPEYDKECEGLFGLDLRAQGHRFGVWGDGKPWVQHIGVRDGKGY